MPQESRSNTEAEFLADQLERSFYGGAWHGLSLAEIVADLDAEAASHRPGADGHSLWQMVHHVRIWLEIASCRIDGEDVACDLARAEDWPEVTDHSPEAWRKTAAALEAAHGKLHAQVKAMTDAELGNPVSGSDPTVRGLILGILQHNAYHGGQLSWLKRNLAARQVGA